MSLDYTGHTQFFAPFVSTTMRIEPAWLGASGHLDLAYYHMLFNRAVSEAFAVVGIGPAYAERHGVSVLATEAHVLCVRKLCGSAPVQVTMRILNIDDKRVHHFLEMRHAAEGWLAATSENLSLHVDLASYEAAPFPDIILAKLAVMKASHGAMRLPEAVGRVMGLNPPPQQRESAHMAGDATRH